MRDQSEKGETGRTGMKNTGEILQGAVRTNPRTAWKKDMAQMEDTAGKMAGDETPPAITLHCQQMKSQDHEMQTRLPYAHFLVPVKSFGSTYPALHRSLT